MKRLFFASTLLLLLVGITSLAPAPKHKYSSKEAKFTVIFPGEFETSESQKETHRSVQIKSTVDNMVYFVGYSVHESEMTEKEELAKVSLNAFVENLQGEITEQSSWKVKQNEGIKANFQITERGFKGEYRIVIIGQIQYQVTAVSSLDYWDEESAEKFFKSFKVKK